MSNKLKQHKFTHTLRLLPSDHQSSLFSDFSAVIFSSMTSLQKEEFFELVATAQARRLDDQRAQLERSPLPKSKARSFRGSLKQLSLVRRPVPAPAPASVPAPVPVPKEDLYNMILTTQVRRLVFRCCCCDTSVQSEQRTFQLFPAFLPPTGPGQAGGPAQQGSWSHG